MPALSPTMTEGNIAAWKVKDGDTFSAGDVLLEIETDKATMDVEAQEDGIMMKIMQQEGSKAVQVGKRIAVVAEAGDDINSLEIPADSQPKEAASEPSSTNSSDSSSSASKPKEQKAVGSKAAGTFEHKHPLLPSVEHLVKQNGLSDEDVSKIQPSGPSNRLLKGDVLAYLGEINAETPAAVSARFEKLSHLDLSNIKVAEKKVVEKPKAVETSADPVIEKLEIQVPVSFAKVIEVQNRIQESLGVFLPLSTFISRAAEVANDDLPLAQREPTASELFDQVLGLDKVKGTRGSRGIYLPQIAAIPPPSVLAARQPKPQKRDIFDELAPRKKPLPAELGIPTVPGLSSSNNVFSLIVPVAEEERAQVFLERCKIILEDEPGRLVV